MFTQVLVQFVKILLGKMCIKPISRKKLLKWLLMKTWATKNMWKLERCVSDKA